MKNYVRFCEKFNKVMLTVGVGCLFAAAIICFVQVVTRNVINYSFKWAEEGVRYIIIFGVFFASGQIFYIDANAKVEIIYNLFPKRVQLYLNYVFYLLITAFLVIMGYYGYRCTANNLTTWCASIHIPWAVPFASLAVGSINMLLQIPAKVYQNHIALKELGQNKAAGAQPSQI
ncbi:MAG TPA: TRAP transporter small permease subunit [Eubacteriales bacterium]|nr:TRAP transporter small permease subunit [Eubacteriales bacterium]